MERCALGGRHDIGDRHAAAGGEHVVARQARIRRRLLPVRVRESDRRQSACPPLVAQLERHQRGERVGGIVVGQREQFNGQQELVGAQCVPQCVVHFESRSERTTTHETCFAQARQTHLILQVIILSLVPFGHLIYDTVDLVLVECEIHQL